MKPLFPLPGWARFLIYLMFIGPLQPRTPNWTPCGPWRLGAVVSVDPLFPNLQLDSGSLGQLPLIPSLAFLNGVPYGGPSTWLFCSFTTLHPNLLSPQLATAPHPHPTPRAPPNSTHFGVRGNGATRKETREKVAGGHARGKRKVSGERGAVRACPGSPLPRGTYPSFTSSYTGPLTPARPFQHPAEDTRR